MNWGTVKMEILKNSFLYLDGIELLIFFLIFVALFIAFLVYSNLWLKAERKIFFLEEKYKRVRADLYEAESELNRLKIIGFINEEKEL